MLLKKKKCFIFLPLIFFFYSYRFGKPRRGSDLNGTLSSEEDNSAERERELARKIARDEQLRIQEQYQRLMQRQAELVCLDDLIFNTIKPSI